jgi:hypothetical protein
MVRVALFCFVLSSIVLIGCSGSGGFPKTYPVTGSVKVNGKAIDGAVVTFQIDGGKENAIGLTDSTGKYTLTMFRPGDGAIPGQYRVAISKPTAAEVAKPNTLPPGQIAPAELPEDYAPPTETAGGAKAAAGAKSEIPAKYSNDQISGLRAVVSDSAPNVFDYDLK